MRGQWNYSFKYRHILPHILWILSPELFHSSILLVSPLGDLKVGMDDMQEKTEKIQFSLNSLSLRATIEEANRFTDRVLVGKVLTTGKLSGNMMCRNCRSSLADQEEDKSVRRKKIKFSRNGHGLLIGRCWCWKNGSTKSVSTQRRSSFKFMACLQNHYTLRMRRRVVVNWAESMGRPYTRKQ